VVETIAKKYGFSYKITPHPRVYPQISQGSMTDWELMVNLASQCGYFLRAESTSLYFQPLLQDFDELVTETRTFSQIDAGFKSLTPMYSFEPLIGETLNHKGADKSAISVAGVDAATGNYFKYTKQRRAQTTRGNAQPEFFDAHATHVVAPDYTTAVLEADSADEKSKFPYTAEAEVIGTAALRPGVPVYLENAGESYSGYWTILEVEHYVVEEQLNVPTFTTRLVVGTDSLGATTSGKYPVKPPEKLIRHIAPNVRNTRVIPSNVIKAPSINIKPAKTINLVNRTNRPTVRGTAVSAASWSSNTGNLNTKQKPAGRSIAGLTKAVNYLARQ
jgi:hypothetical protein